MNDPRSSPVSWRYKAEEARSVPFALLFLTVMDYEHGTHETSSEQYRLEPEVLDTDFKKEFPPDPAIGHEMDDVARVWKVYRREAEWFDSTLLEGWSATIDGLLIPAGLFSAVVTAFVVESYQFLQLDNTAYTATALYILVATSNHSSPISLPSPPSLGSKSSASRWINGLWFTSILLSLVVAFLSILVKQCIIEYRSRTIGPVKNPRAWALRREFYALHRWPISEVVSFLPVLLHLSLFLFFAGLVLFLWALDHALGAWIIALVLVLSVIYLGCTFIPLCIPQVPTATPLILQIRRLLLSLTVLTLRLLVRMQNNALMSRWWALTGQCTLRLKSVQAPRITVAFGEWVSRLCNRAAYSMKRVVRSFTVSRGGVEVPDLPSTLHPPPIIRPTFGVNISHACSQALQRLWRTHPMIRTDFDLSARLNEVIEILRRDTPSNRIELEPDDLEASALSWLILDNEDADTVAVGLQALGAIHPAAPLAERLRLDDRLAEFPERYAFTYSTTEYSPAEMLRVARSILCMSRGPCRLEHRAPSLFTTRTVAYPDFDILRLMGDRGAQPQDVPPPVLPATEAAYRALSPSLTSTAVHALRLQAFDHASLRTMQYLACCNFDRFSDRDWNLALQRTNWASDLSANRAVLRFVDAPAVFKPIGLAITVQWHYRVGSADRVHRHDHQLTRRLMDCVDRQLIFVDFARTTSEYPPLGLEPLQFFASADFIREYEKDSELRPSLQLVTSWICSARAKEINDTSEMSHTFWAALQGILCAATSLEDPTHWLGLVEVPKVCKAVLLSSPHRIDGVRSALHGMLDSHPLTELSQTGPQSVWVMICRMLLKFDTSAETWLDLAAVLAAALCFESQRAQGHDSLHAENEGHIAMFLEVVDPGRFIWRLKSWARDYTEQIPAAHLFHHCRQLRPQWFYDALFHYGGPHEERTMVQKAYDQLPMGEPCKWCPDEPFHDATSMKP